MWEVIREVYDPKENYIYETLFTLANGFVSIRGIEEFSSTYKPLTFVAGIFDGYKAQVPELVNLPNPFGINLYVENERINIDFLKMTKYQRRLNLRSGVLSSYYELSTLGLAIESERFVSRKSLHRIGIKYTIKSIGFKGKIILENYIDNTTANNLFDPANKVQHYKLQQIGSLKPGIYSVVKTYDRKHKIAISSSLLGVGQNNDNILLDRKYIEIGPNPTELYTCFLNKNSSITIYKFVTIFTSRESEKPFEESVSELEKFVAQGYETELEEHQKAMESIWENVDVTIKGDSSAQLGIRFNIFHLFSCASNDPTVSIGARGLHGEGYKGHVFWDTEIFMFPFFLYTLPNYAKNLLLYRYNTLEGARKNAYATGYKGARFAWESADDGTEVTPKWGVDYLGNPVRIWTADEEIHITADISIAIVNYHIVTGDDEFMKNYGVEILLDTAKFWISRLEYNNNMDRYEIKKVIGPDEFHEHVDNNVYTNYLAKWNILKAYEYYHWLKERDKGKLCLLKTLLGISEEEINKWRLIAEKIYIPRKDNQLLLEQFEGYFNLKDYVVTEFDEKGMPVWPKDLDLSKLQETQLIKQPDVVMLILVLPDEFSYDEMKKNYEYYLRRTMHKSSLSLPMYSIMGLKVGDTRNAYNSFMKTLLVDLENTHGNTHLGFHAACAGGAWQVVANGFAGIRVRKDGELVLDPWLPEHWEELSLKIFWKGVPLKITVRKEEIIIESLRETDVIVKSKLYHLKEGTNRIKI
ncbi:glycoside hydrolase family 65 protein [Pseudothermotoga thermarum]|uniref:Glycoside hydrolase family 65 central catalytic n=1 Tax=Pseudothermotoga thermarum DSM 5069 TaxID=688269 RepID=F7YXC4_9THEM|nr:glycosyl hydrolase family 65 protein [Pseudothermotoga thermarum]AEH51605.1 glycoside hydrolase family 65 central catalytic [Pseudothermotoga thermarum DSM 5069]